MLPTKEIQLRMFVHKMTETSGYNEEKIREILREEFGKYDPEKESEYALFIEKKWRTELLEAKLANNNKPPTFNTDAPCPICGAPTYDTIVRGYRGALSRRFVCEKDSRPYGHWWDWLPKMLVNRG